MTLTFEVPYAPVSVNATYKRGRGKRLYLSQAAKDYKAAVKAYAFAARCFSAWPHPSSVLAVELEIVTYNTRHDVDAPIKATADALEGVLYANDRAVRAVTGRKATDGLGRRVVVIARRLDA